MTLVPSASRPQFFSRTDVLVICGIVVVLLLIGSISDLRLSTALYESEAGWAILLAAIGEWPAGFGLVVAGVFLIRGRNPSNAVRARVQAGGGALLALLGTAMVSFLPTMYVNLPTSVVLLTGMALSMGVIVGSWRLTSARTPRELLRFGVGLFLVVVGEMIIINLIKVGWSRPRMRMLNSHPEYSFNSWWIVGSADKAEALSQGISSEEFKSFPSGHTANAAVLMYLLPILAWMSERGRNLIRPAIYVGLVWALAVAASRIAVGAHFLTDVTAGLLVSFLVVLAAHHVVARPWGSLPAEPTTMESSDAH